MISNFIEKYRLKKEINQMRLELESIKRVLSKKDNDEQLIIGAKAVQKRLNHSISVQEQRLNNL